MTNVAARTLFLILTAAALAAATVPPATAGPVYVFPIIPAGQARFGRYHHDYPATDILAPRGARFVAPTHGRVDEVSRRDRWNPRVNSGEARGGLFVSIIGDDGVRYYGSHLQRVDAGIEPGARVSAGQPLGRIGTSGDARGTAPHLHFGISCPPSIPRTSRDWQIRRGQISPYPYLTQWRRGRTLRPALPATLCQKSS
jgi:murein DD-endopeptidase MepM/ murein hydrolase activator NlpD